MVLVQSILFFVLGAALSAFILALFVPLAWRRALYFADKAVKSQIPLSLNEVEATHDFTRADHALELCLLEEKIRAAQKAEMAARISANKAREKIVYLEPFEQEAFSLQQKVIQQKAQITLLQKNKAALENKIFNLEAQSARDAKHINKLKTRNMQIHSLKQARTSLRRQIAKQEKELKHYQQTVLLHETEKEALANFEQEMTSLRGEMQNTAAEIVAHVAQEEGEQSPIVAYIEDTTTEILPQKDSLATLIRHALTDKKQRSEA